MNLPPFPREITIGEKYRPAMAITDPDEAAKYFAACVEHCMRVAGKERAEAEEIERQNLGYFARYYDDETRARVEQLFSCAHPIFGKLKDRGPPTPMDALAAGVHAAGGETGPTVLSLALHLNIETCEALKRLTRSTAVPNGTLPDVVHHLIASAVAGVNRSGSWERGWLEQAFGAWSDDAGDGT